MGGAGDYMTSADSDPFGNLTVVTAVRSWTGTHDMRNLTVDELHTYYVLVGVTPVLVHNCKKPDKTYATDAEARAEAMRDAGIGPDAEPYDVYDVEARHAPSRGGKVQRDAFGNPIKYRREVYENDEGDLVAIDRHEPGHTFDGETSPSHYHARPWDEEENDFSRSDVVPGTRGHYHFE